MANIYRLIFALFALCFSSLVFSQAVPKTTMYKANYTGSSLRNSVSSACSDAVAYRNSPEGCTSGLSGGACTSSYSLTGITGTEFGTCKITGTPKNGGNTPYSADIPWSTVKACPEGYTARADGLCDPPVKPCEAGYYKDSTGKCVPTEDTECKAFYAMNNTIGGSLGSMDYRLQGRVADGSRFCMPGQFDNANRGCKVQFNQTAVIDYGGGHVVSDGRFSEVPGTTGLACNVGDVETPAKPPDEKCKNGYTGTVNGVEVCVNKVPDSGVSSDDTSTTTNDGTNTTTTNTHSETNCKDGRCTTTTTVTTTVTNNSTGTSTTTTTTGSTSESQGTFCQRNPSNKACGGGKGGDGDDGSLFSGSCSAGFQCEGDAIQCSIAREQHRRACKLFDDKSPESELYDKEKGKEGSQTKDLPGNEAISIQGKIDTTDALGGGSGLSDMSITVWRTSVNLPFSMLNKYLAAMGNVLVGVSLLVAFRIVARG